MSKRDTMLSSSCPVARALAVLGDPWTLLILRDVFDGSRRFGEFQRGLGVAKNILSDRLRGLVEHGILAVAPAADGSAYQEYRITDKGESLFPILVGLRQWGEDHLYARGERHSTLVERASGKALPRMQPQNNSGAPLRAADTVVKKI